jgi:hypothetical protein
MDAIISTSNDITEALRMIGFGERGSLNELDTIALKGTGESWSHIRFLKSFLLDRGFDIFPREPYVRQRLLGWIIAYESGVSPRVTPESYQLIPYIHIQLPILWNTITHLVTLRHKRGLMKWWPYQRHDTLYIMLSLDKGGHSTKLQLTWLNHSNPQCEDATLILGTYESGEEHAVIQRVFGPMLKMLGNWPLHQQIVSTSQYGVERKQLPSIMSSSKCERCSAPYTVPLAPLNIKLTSMIVTFGGDIMALSEIVGISGPCGVYFCLSCQGTLSSLEYKEDSYHGSNAEDHGRSDARTTASMYEWNESFASHHYAMHNYIRITFDPICSAAK